MGKIFSGLLTIILIVIIGGAIFMFGFDKKIPESWVSAQIEATKQSKIVEDDEINIKSASYFYEEITYTAEGSSTVKTYNNKMCLSYKDKSTETAKYYETESKKYDTKGDLSEQYTTKYYEEDGVYYKEEKGVKTVIASLEEAKIFFIFFFQYYKADDYALKDEILDAIDNKLSYVSQKGTNITLHMAEDDMVLDISYSLTANKVVKIESTMDTVIDGVLKSRTHQYITF